MHRLDRRPQERAYQEACRERLGDIAESRLRPVHAWKLEHLRNRILLLLGRLGDGALFQIFRNGR
jgi:hypothetical protein